ncbi:MAG TPA: RNA methyltransferase, partial [Bacteroidota bacterium]|nr:RNA methyltransferase [Bacteroidota bacterium]
MKSPANVRRVTSLDVPELQPYRTLRRPMEHIKQGIFVAEGEKVVRRLLESNMKIISMLMTPEWNNRLFPNEHPTSNIEHRKPLTDNPKPFDVFIAEQELLETIVGYNLHQGIMAVAAVPESMSIGETITRLTSPHLVVALDGLVNAENVGLVVRNCAALGVDVLIAGETSSSPYLRRAVRNSMGAVFRLPVVHSTSLVESLHLLRRAHHTRIIAAHPQGECT